MLRLITNKARHHYNAALEHAERGRTAEAIDELHNALDLDQRSSNAYVVLGTLHARQANFDRAREAWAAALALQPELTKAHQYLQRVDKVEKQLPAVRRLRIAGAVLLLATIGLAISLVFMGRESPATGLVRAAQTALAQRDYGRALEHLSAARQKARPNSASDVAATVLQSALQSELRQEVRQIQDLKYREEYPQVLAAIADLEARNPDPATAAALVNIREDVNHYYLGQLRRLFAEYEAQTVAYEEFLQKAREFFNAYPDIPEKQNIAAFLDRAQEIEAARRFADIRTSFAAVDDIQETVEALRHAREEFDESPAAQQGRTETVDLILSTLFDDFQLLVDSQDFEGATELLGQIEDLADEFRDVVDISGPANLAGRVLTDVWTGARLQEAEQLVREGNADQAREALLLLAGEAESLTTPARELVLNLEEDLDRREDQQVFESLRARRSTLMKGDLEDADATRTFALASRLAERLEAEDQRAEALAYAAAAAFHADDRETANRLSTLVRKESKLEAALATELQNLLRRRTSDLQRRPQPPPTSPPKSKPESQSKPPPRQTERKR